MLVIVAVVVVAVVLIGGAAENDRGTKDLEVLCTQASHGCIRMSPTAVKALMQEVEVATPVFLQ